MRIPKSYSLAGLDGKVTIGPLWLNIGHSVFGQAMHIETPAEPRLYPLDLIEYEHTVYIIPAEPDLLENTNIYGKTVQWSHDKTRALCIEREKWLELNNEAIRMKRWSIPKVLRISHA